MFGNNYLVLLSKKNQEGENEEAAEVEAELDKVHTKLVQQKKNHAAKENDDIELRTSDDNPEIQISINKDDPENPTAVPSRYRCLSSIINRFIFRGQENRSGWYSHGIYFLASFDPNFLG